MKKLLLTVVVLLLPHVASAQGWVRALWDINPPAEGVVYYVVQLDNGSQQTVQVSGPQCSAAQNSCYADYEIHDNAQHSISVVATNAFGISPAARISFGLGVPTMPANLRVTDPFATTTFQTVTPGAPAARSGPPRSTPQPAGPPPPPWPAGTTGPKVELPREPLPPGAPVVR
jgi:hypothetical protein